MELTKIVVHYSDGRIVKGSTQDFSPNKDHFNLFMAGESSDKTIEVLIKELKAVFLVRDFIGNSLYNERKEYIEEEKPFGQRVKVTFMDGEVLVGATLGYDPKQYGFFFTPADSKSNNIRVFAVSSSVKHIMFL